MPFYFPTREPKPSDIEIFLARPDRTIIHKIKDRIRPQHNIRLGQLNEITFSIPYDIERNHGIIRYPVVDEIQQRYLLKIKVFDQEEWYVIDKITDTADDREMKEIHAYSLGYELANKIIYQWAGVWIDGKFQKVSLNAQQVLENVLSETIWGIDYIDTKFKLTYREFDFTNTTRLDAVFQIAETFGALIVWNTENRTISLYDLKTYGLNRGLTFKEGRYLKSIKHEESSDEMVTHFKAYGKEGLTLNRVNPTGSDFIVDYSYFIDDYTTDELGNVISHSKFMSDSLCQAILDYQAKIVSYEGQFETLLANKETKQTELTTLNNQLDTLKTELALIRDTMDIKMTNNQDYSLERTQETNKLNEISAKETEISNKEAEIAGIDAQIETIKNDVSVTNNFTQEQIIEKAQFEYERVWEDQNIYDDKILLERAKEAFADLRNPKSVFEVDIVNYLAVEECNYDWDKFSIGDKCNIRYTKLNIDVISQMVEFNIDYDGNSISVVIANTIDGNTDEDEVAKYIYNSISTSATVNLNKSKFYEFADVKNDVRELYEGNIEAAKREITAGVNETVKIDRRGITTTDDSDPLRFIRITNSVIGLTNTGGNDFRTAITADGISASEVVGQLLMGEKVIISDADGTFVIDGNLLTIKDQDGNERVALGEYVDNTYGMRIRFQNNEVALDQSGMLQSWQDSKCDNLDDINPLILNVYIPNETISIKKALLRFKLLPFRAYSKGTASNPQQSTTSASATINLTTTQSGGSSSPTSLTSSDWHQWGIDVPDAVSSEGGHNHGIADGTALMKADGGTVWFYELYSHTHRLQSDHSHVVNIPSHSHGISMPSHSHSVTLPSHNHDIDYGIYTSTSASGVSCIINGIDRTTVLGGKFYGDRSGLDITPYLTIGQWNEIKLTSNQLGRIDATVFTQIFMGV